MAASVTGICNRGLNMIGQPPILNLTEDSEPARVCNLIWESVRDEVFRAFPWRCITKRASLARLSATPVFGFDYYYQLPTDYIRMVGMDYTDRIYDIEGDKLLYDGDTAYIKYIYRETDANRYDSLLCTCLAIRMGVELAYKIPGSSSRAKELFDIYRLMIGHGRSVDSQEGLAQQMEAEDWVDEHS